jgi:hypothetical protein
MFRNAGVPIHNVHVGVQIRDEPGELVRADAASAEWIVDVNVDAGVDPILFRGPAVHGRGTERFIYLTWGDVGDSGTFAMFRRAKLRLDRVDPALVRTAVAQGRPLVATIDLTDEFGGPRCATPSEPALVWSV